MDAVTHPIRRRDLLKSAGCGFGYLALAGLSAERARAEEAALPSVIGNRFEDGTAGRAGVAVGTIALLGAVGLSVADRVVGRRSRRTIT